MSMGEAASPNRWLMVSLVQGIEIAGAWRHSRRWASMALFFNGLREPQ